MRRAALALLLVPGLMAQAPQPDDAAARREEVRKLLKVMDAGNLAVQAMKQAAEAQKKTHPEIPDAFWEGMLKELTADRMVEIAEPVYERNFTREEVRALITFYSTPEGRAVMQKFPTVMKECMEAGQKVGAEVGKQVAERLHAEGKL